MKLGFSGYGGKYCVGKLTSTEVENITELVSRFDTKLFLTSQETKFDTNDFKMEYYDFDDIYECETVSVPCNITVDELPEGCKLHLDDIFTSDDTSIIINTEPPLKDGFYLISTSEQKGNFFTIELDVLPEDFDMSLLQIYCSDLDIFSMSDVVIEDIYYDGKCLGFDTDSYYTDDKAFSQSILYVENGVHYDGIEIMKQRTNISYPIIECLNGLSAEKIIGEYLEFVEAKNSGYLLNKGYPLAFVSPMLYAHYSKEEIDELWMTEENIKFVMQHNLIDCMPTDIYDRIIGRFPEWLI
jgi:hypothetical protein